MDAAVPLGGDRSGVTRRLRLAEARTVGDGIQILIYEKVA
jgi:hypothetical protein